MKHLANRAVRAFGGSLHRFPVRTGEDIPLLDDDPAGLGQLVDPVSFTEASPEPAASLATAIRR